MRPLDATTSVWALTALLLAGCPSKSTVDTFPVKGKVLVNGKPAAGAVITLWPADRSTTPAWLPHGSANDQGEFELNTFHTRDGAPAGDYRVGITWPAPKSRAAGKKAVKPVDRLKGAFVPARSPFQIRIEPGPNRLPDFELQFPLSKSGDAPGKDRR